MTQRELAVWVAKSFHGRWYLWGGDDPAGFDCSGLVLEALQSVGAFPRKEDATADRLMRTLLAKGGALRPTDGDHRPGDVCFFVNTSGLASHVVMLVDPPQFYIGAEGGGPGTTTVEEARRRNAFIKIRPLASRGRPETRIVCNPF